MAKLAVMTLMSLQASFAQADMLSGRWWESGPDPDDLSSKRSPVELRMNDEKVAITYSRADLNEVFGPWVSESWESAKRAAQAKMFLPNIGEQASPGGGGMGTGGLGQLGSSSSGPLGAQGLQIIPSITIAERYDSNVFYVKATPGVKTEDYVTTVAPQLFVRNMGRLVDASLQAGAFGERYVNNPGLSYVGFQAGVNLGFDQLVQRYIQGATLRVGDSFLFTPTPPAFLTNEAVQSQALGPENTNGVTPSDFFVRGIQASRVNTYTNTGTIAASAPLTQNIRLAASYANSIIRFGTPFVKTTQSTFISTTNHTATAGPQIKLTPLDTVSINYLYTGSNVEGAGSSAGSYQSHGGTVGWGRIVSPELSMNLNAGATLVQIEGLGTAGAINSVSYIGSASMAWNRRTWGAQISYSAGIYPSYLVGAGPLLSQNVSIMGTHRMLDNRLIATVGGNYSRNDSIEQGPAVNQFAFTSYGANAGASYAVGSSTWMSLNYVFLLFQGTPGLVGEFTRSAVTLSVTQYWK